MNPGPQIDATTLDEYLAQQPVTLGQCHVIGAAHGEIIALPMTNGLPHIVLHGIDSAHRLATSLATDGDRDWEACALYLAQAYAAAKRAVQS